MMDDGQVLNRKLRAFAPAKVDRLKGEQKEFEEMLKNKEEENKGKKRRRILICTVVLMLAAVLSAWASSLFIPVERELAY